MNQSLLNSDNFNEIDDVKKCDSLGKDYEGDSEVTTIGK